MSPSLSEEKRKREVGATAQKMMSFRTRPSVWEVGAFERTLLQTRIGPAGRHVAVSLRIAGILSIVTAVLCLAAACDRNRDSAKGSGGTSGQGIGGAPTGGSGGTAPGGSAPGGAGGSGGSASGRGGTSGGSGAGGSAESGRDGAATGGAGGASTTGGAGGTGQGGAGGGNQGGAGGGSAGGAGMAAAGGTQAAGGTVSSGGTRQSGGETGGGGKGSTPGAGGNSSTGGTAGPSGGTTLSTGGNAGGTGGTNTGGTSTSSSQPAIGPIKNPVIKGYWADPQIAFFGGKFYIYPTTDGIANWGATVFHAFSSTDLAGWKDEGIILDLATISWGKTNAWAPGITVKNGTYYFYFCDAKQIGVATSTSPTGPFKDVLGKPLVTAGQYGGQSIDPYVFDDDDGRSYLFFGNGNAKGAELNADMTSFKTTPKTIALDGFREGSAVFKRNGKYYFMYSVSGTDYPDYRVSYASSNLPLEPYTAGATILQSNSSLGILSTGHNSVLALPNGEYYIVYHRWAIPGGDGNHREICIDKMSFNADGTIAPVVPTL
jgi:hypothetical protein